MPERGIKMNVGDIMMHAGFGGGGGGDEGGSI